MTCPLCDEGKTLYCPICFEPVTLHSHEGDYWCKHHGERGLFVTPWSEERLIALRNRLASLGK